MTALLLLDKCDDCVELVDASGAILWMNERRQRLLASCGMHVHQGSAWLDLWAEPYRDAAAAAMTSASNTGRAGFTAPFSGNPGTTGWWDVAVTSKGSDALDGGHTLSIARDVTSYINACRDREQLLDDERNVRLAIERENRKRDYALLVAAHELGAPLYAVRGWAQYLQLGKLEPDEFAEAVDAIGRNTDRQYELIERLLEVARFRSKSASFALLPNSIEEIIVDAIECVRPVARSKEITIHSEISTSTRVLADFDQLQRAFSNLLFNAVKFTPPDGTITVRCTESPGCVTIEVTDTGAGINSDFLERVFEPFTQEPATQQPAMIGLGLGLSIVRRIVEGHHGSVRVFSQGRSQGTTFVIDLPAMSRTIA